MMSVIGASQRQQIALPLRFLGGVALALAAGLAAFYLVMQPPAGEIRAMAIFLSVTALISALAGYLAYRLGWLSRLPRVSWTLLAGYGLAALLTFLNVGFSARLMFASEHDLLLAGVLLLFAGGIAMSLGYFVAATLTDRMAQLNAGAQAIAQGRLDTRVPVEGSDEMAQLAQAFNDMAARLEEADRKQRELDQLRRDLIAWAGHDLRTPLASTRVIVEALADGVVEDPATEQRYLRTAQRDIQQLTLLIDDLFDLAQMDAGGLRLDRQPNAISDLISDTLESFSALAGQANIILEGSVEPGIDPAWIDARQIGRVLNNLVGNALRHTPAGGRVSIQCSVVSDQLPVISNQLSVVSSQSPPHSELRITDHGLLMTDHWLLLTVSDSGEGILTVDLPHIFDRFYRGEKSRSRASGGAGLGLAIARGIVEAHGGQIWIESTVGKGTTFCFTLPRDQKRLADHA